MTTARELLDLAEVERLTLEPGDWLVFKVQLRLNMAEYDELNKQIAAVLPEVRYMILDNAMDVAVVRNSPDAP